MTLAAMIADRPTLISLVADADAPLFARMFGKAPFADARHIAIGGEAAARRAVLAARIDAAVAQAERRVVIVAHGIGCNAAAWWARLSPPDYVSRVAGAILIAPAAPATRAFAAPRCALPFPSVVVGAGHDPQAREWGSRVVASPVALPGHRGAGLVRRFTAAVVAREVRTAEALMGLAADW